MDEDISKCTVSSESATPDAAKIEVLRELCVISNNVSFDEFMAIMTEKNAYKKVKWATVYNCLREQISKTLTQDWEDLWMEENLVEKLEGLQQRAKVCRASTKEKAWRPGIGDALPQMRSHYMKLLRAQKNHTEELVHTAEANVETLKSELLMRRNYLRAVNAEVSSATKSNLELQKQIENGFKNKKSGNVEQSSEVIKFLQMNCS